MKDKLLWALMLPPSVHGLWQPHGRELRVAVFVSSYQCSMH